MMTTSTDLLAAIRSAVNGISLIELQAAFPDLARRTLQRRITGLLEDRQVSATGQGRARRYFVNQRVDVEAISPADMGVFGAVSWSPDSRDVLTYIGSDLGRRRPVGYQADFLASYVPNESEYLPASIRRQLHRMGQTSDVEAPAGTYSRALLNRLMIDLSWASSHLEGNTYSRLDTRRLIEQGQAARGKAAMDTQMILNHKAAIELLVENMERVGIDRNTLLNIHAALAENLLPNPMDEGRVRQHAVDISMSCYRPLSIPSQIDEQLGQLLAKANLIHDPFEQSFFLMVHLPYLQPFADINKRTSRLAANLPLFRANLCPLTFLDVPKEAYIQAMLGVYEMTRIEPLRDLYVWAYERSTQEYLAIKQNLAEPDPLRLAWRNLIKQTVREVVTQPKADPVSLVREAAAQVPASSRADVQALMMEELRRLHEGVLARYGLRPSEFHTWQAAQDATH